jgi:ribosomal protein S18 acetylase RimI-like enzyme
MSELNALLTNPPCYEPLASHHDRAGFDCGEESLNQFLRQRARQNAERNLGVTHVVVADPGETAILGYYTLLVRSIEREDFASAKKLPPGEIGVALLARLAVSRAAQGRGLGSEMLLRAITQTERAARDLGVHALVVHALNERAKSWYLGLDFGFELLTDDPLHLCLSIGKIRQLGLEE